MGSFILVYLLYQYNGLQFSGWKGLILGPRFFIPLLPLFCLTFATYINQQSHFIKKWAPRSLLFCAVLAFAIVNGVGSFYGQRQYELVQSLYQPQDKVHFIHRGHDTTKYANLFYSEHLVPGMDILQDTSMVHRLLEKDSIAFVHLITRKDTPAKKTLGQKNYSELERLDKLYKIVQRSEKIIPGGTTLVTWTIGKKDEHANIDHHRNF